MYELKHKILASDGWPFIISGLVVFIVALKFSFWFLALLCLIYFVAAFFLFRDPHRDIPSLPLAVVSPVDGIIKDIRHVEEGLLKRASAIITIDIHKSGAYTTRSPTEGKIMSLSDAEAGSRLIETAGLWIRTDENEDVVMLMKSSGISSLYPAKAHVGYGERIGQGERVGLNRLTQISELYLPDNARIVVEIGEKVLAGTTVLAKYYREGSEEE